MGDNDKKVFTPTEFRQLFRVSRPTMYRLLESGDVRSFRLGPRTIRIPASELDRLSSSANLGRE